MPITIVIYRSHVLKESMQFKIMIGIKLCQTKYRIEREMHIKITRQNWATQVFWQRIKYQKRWFMGSNISTGMAAGGGGPAGCPKVAPTAPKEEVAAEAAVGGFQARFLALQSC